MKKSDSVTKGNIEAINNNIKAISKYREDSTKY